MRRSIAITVLLTLAAASASANPDTPSRAATQAAPRPAPPSPLVRADVSGTLGMATVHVTRATFFDESNDWIVQSLYGAVGAGWYWTDHHKTEVQFGGNTGVRLYTGTP